MNKKIILLGISVSFLLLGTGCSTKQETIIHKRVVEVQTPKPYQFKLKPIIGSSHDDARTIVDTGVVLKMTVNSYKNRNENLVASHDVYVWARKPEFIVGEELPSRKRSSGMITPSGKLPFSLSVDNVDRGSAKSDEEIKKFHNGVYELEKRKNKLIPIKKGMSKNDKKIKEFLQSNK